MNTDCGPFNRNNGKNMLNKQTISNLIAIRNEAKSIQKLKIIYYYCQVNGNKLVQRTKHFSLIQNH